MKSQTTPVNENTLENLKVPYGIGAVRLNDEIGLPKRTVGILTRSRMASFMMPQSSESTLEKWLRTRKQKTGSEKSTDE